MNHPAEPPGGFARTRLRRYILPRYRLWAGILFAFTTLNSTGKAEAGEQPEDVLSDASISCIAPMGWRQPDSTGLGGYEGYCGQKSIANILLFEGKEVLPKDVASTCHDATPGTRPDTLLQCLNAQSEKVWHACDARCLGINLPDYNQNSLTFLKMLSSRLAIFIASHGPVIALTQESAVSYHWQVVTESGHTSVTTMESRRDKASYRNLNPRHEFAQKWGRQDGFPFPYLFFYTSQAPPVWTGSEDGCEFVGNRKFAEAVKSVSPNP